MTMLWMRDFEKVGRLHGTGVMRTDEVRGGEMPAEHARRLTREDRTLREGERWSYAGSRMVVAPDWGPVTTVRSGS